MKEKIEIDKKSKMNSKTKSTKSKPKIKKEKIVEEAKIIAVPQKTNTPFTGYFPLLAFSFITSIVSLLTVYYINKTNVVYFFSGFNDYISIDSGLIAINTKSNSFEGNNIQYINKNDIIAVKYEVGYYLKDNNIDIPLMTISGDDERGASIKKVIENMIRYNFIEQANIGEYLPKESIELLKNNQLYFIIKYTNTTSGKISDNRIELHLNILNTK